jgi:hypothetical protein
VRSTIPKPIFKGKLNLKENGYPGLDKRSS